MILQERGKQFTLTLPKSVIEAMGWKKGNKVEVRVASKDKLELVRV